jgi:hypothetical protein
MIEGSLILIIIIVHLIIRKAKSNYSKLNEWENE